MSTKDSYDEIFADVEKVMMVFAHPDDAEIYCGGLISRLVDDGKQVMLVKMTTGNKGSRQEKISEQDLAEIREQEDHEALAVLGLKAEDSVNLDLGDGEVENDTKTLEKLVKQIRKFKPDLVVTHNPEKVLVKDPEGFFYVNHRDHRNTALSVVDAVYPYSRDILFFPEHIGEGLDGHIVLKFLFVDSWGDQDQIGIDITDYIERRTAAIACHKSQYSSEDAQGSTDFFARQEGDQRFELFKYVEID